MLVGARGKRVQLIFLRIAGEQVEEGGGRDQGEVAVRGEEATVGIEAGPWCRCSCRWRRGRSGAGHAARGG